MLAPAGTTPLLAEQPTPLGRVERIPIQGWAKSCLAGEGGGSGGDGERKAFRR